MQHKQLFAFEDPGTETLRVPVVKVFDGDGFLTRVRHPIRNTILEASVRFGFIDAPEMGQPGGKEAKEFLSSLISEKWLDLVILTKMDTGGIVDRHGRIVAVPYLMNDQPGGGILAGLSPNRMIRKVFARGSDSRNIELEMVLNGWAWVLDRYEPDDCYFDALEDAKRQRRGIWARDDNVHPWEFKKRRYQMAKPNRQVTPLRNLFDETNGGSDCPREGCGGRLVQKSGQFGAFMGCSNFPKCKYSRSMR